MTYAKHALIVDRLAELTEQGRVDWRKAPDDETIQVSFAKNSVQLSKVARKEGESPIYALLFRDATGEVVDRVSDVKIDLELFDKVDDVYYHRLEAMFEAGRRKAFGADKVLNEILQALDI